MSKKLSIVVSVYNEEKALPLFDKECRKYLNTLSIEHEILYVNDGSIDGSADIIKGFLRDFPNETSYIALSRNFGHEAAMCAGLDHALGDLIIFLDADLQHPPMLIPLIYQKYKEGYDVIKMVRESNKSAGFLNNIFSSLFYKLINRMSKSHFEANASDFFAIDRKVQDILKKNYRERIRFLRGYIQVIGFKSTNLYYKADKRIAGESKYSFSKLLNLSLNTIMSFSNMPLKLGIYAGLISAIMGLIVLIYTLITHNGAPSGYATIVVLICFMFTMLFFVVGIIGEYISVIFTEIKERPIYIIEEKL